MREQYLTPAELVIEELGVRPLARAVKRAPSTVSRWRNREDGLVPSEYHRTILRLAGRKITASELVHGRTVRR